VYWEGTLNADLERNLANGERFSRTPWPLREITTPWKTWTRLRLPFNDVYVNLDVISGTEVWDVAPEALGIN
jgi:hypothetical protein